MRDRTARWPLSGLLSLSLLLLASFVSGCGGDAPTSTPADVANANADGSSDSEEAINARVNGTKAP